MRRSDREHGAVGLESRDENTNRTNAGQLCKPGCRS